MGGSARFVRVLVAGAVAAGLVGCGGAGPPGQVLAAATPEATSDVAPETSAQSSAEQSASASPRPTLLVTELGELPEAARKHTPKGAEAFVRYWVDAANAAFATGEIGVWRELNAPSCKSCAGRIADVEAAYGSGGRIEGGQLEILSIVASPLEPGTIPQVIVDVAITPERSFDADGRLLKGDRGGQVTLVFLVVWNKPGWLVASGKRGVHE